MNQNTWINDKVGLTQKCNGGTRIVLKGMNTG